jgi:hypothetical protein
MRDSPSACNNPDVDNFAPPDCSSYRIINFDYNWEMDYRITRSLQYTFSDISVNVD